MYIHEAVVSEGGQAQNPTASRRNLADESEHEDWSLDVLPGRAIEVIKALKQFTHSALEDELHV